MKKQNYLFYLVVFVGALFMACSKDSNDSTGTSVLSVRLTDAPGNYDAVYIDIQGVEVTGSIGGPVNLNINAGVYNLLDYTNGIDTLLAMGSVASGKVEQIRLILGSNNSVVVDGVTHPLSTPSAQQSGLKLQIHETFSAGVAYMLLLDFDAQQSIVEQGNGGYSLKPVIRVVNSAISGSITGTIVPPGVICSVTAENNGMQYSTYSHSTGSFLLMGVPQGTYTVTITPDPPLVPVVLNNVNVTNGNITDVGPINF